MKHRRLLMLVMVGVGVPMGSQAVVLADTIEAGYDLWRSVDAYHDFSETPIPADFFDSGSDPFEDVVSFVGEPIEEFMGVDLGPWGVDTIVRRMQSADLPSAGSCANQHSPCDCGFAGCPCPDPIPLDCTEQMCDAGSCATVDIEVVALSLKGADPITVHYPGGDPPYDEEWEVRIALSSAPATPGKLMYRRDDLEGPMTGTYDGHLEARPLFIFSKVGADPPVSREFDAGAILDDSTPIDTIEAVPWQQDPPHAEIPKHVQGLIGNFYIMETSKHAGGHTKCQSAVLFPPTPIPTVPEWGLVAMTLLMLTAGTVVYVKGKPTRT